MYVYCMSYNDSMYVCLFYVEYVYFMSNIMLTHEKISLGSNICLLEFFSQQIYNRGLLGPLEIFIQDVPQNMNVRRRF